MTITLTSRLGLSQWGAGSDPPGRTQFNTQFARIDASVAVDDGTNPAALPTTGMNGQPLADARYAQMVNGSYRQLYRRAAGAWAQVGGNMWPETFYHRAAGALATTAQARQVSHPSLTNPGAVENWDGSSVRGGLQAVGDVNAAQPGALYVGDITSTVDLAVRGRIYGRTTADGQRAIVASAHAATAGNLFTARDSSGSEPWTIDATGRMRSQAATAFGAAALTTGVPFASMAGASDASAADFYANAGKFATRWWRAAGDTTPIGSITDTAIVLGRTPWTGGSISLIAPTTVTGTLGVTGALAAQAGLAVTGAATVSTTLGVSGASTLAALTATTTQLGATTAASLTVTAAATVGTTLGVSGQATLASLAVTAAATVGTTLAVSGATTLAALTANGAAALKSGVTVTGAASVSGDTTLSGRLGLPTSQLSGTANGQIRVASDYTVEVYDGSAWHGNFGTDTAANASGRKHYWDDQNVPLGGSDAYTLVTGFDDALSPQGSIATLSAGSLTLNKAGLWAINCSFYCDSTKDGLNRLQFRWTSGAFPGRSFMTDVRTRQQTGGLGGSGNGEATITWVGWVSSAAAAQAIQVWAAQRTSDGSNGNCIFTLSAEYLGR